MRCGDVRVREINVTILYVRTCIRQQVGGTMVMVEIRSLLN